MTVDIQQLETIRYQFTDLGRTLQTLSDKNEELFSDALKSLKEGFQPLAETLSSELLKSLSSVSRLQEDMKNQGNSEKLHAEFFIKSSIAVDHIGKIVIDINSIDKFNELFKKSPSDFLLKVKTDKKGNVTGFGFETKKRPSTYWQKELSNIKSITTGFMNKVYIPSPGKVGATILGMIGLGFMDQDRVKAEAGELANVLVEATDASMKKVVASAKKELSDLQENLQKNYGIARQETQGALAALIQGGVKVSDIMRELDVQIAGVDSNLETFTLAMDKMFELSGGTTANRMVQLMADYGKNVDEARESVYKMMMAGKESGIGTMNFLKSVDTAGGTLKKFGFNIDEIVNLSVALQDGFEKMGLPKQFAGKFAAEGLQSIANSVANMSNDMRSFIAVRMGYANELGPEAVMAFDNAVARIKREKGGSSEELQKIIYTMASIALEQQGGDKLRAKYMLKNFSGFNLKEEGAEAALQLKEALDKGDKVQAHRVQAASEEAFRDAFVTEREKTKEFDLQLNEVLKGVAEMGQGILGLTVNALSNLIVTFQALYMRFNDLTIPELLTWLATGEKPNRGGKFAKDEEKVEKAYKEISRLNAANIDKIISGWDKFSHGMKGMGENFLGKNLDMLKQAFYLSSEIAGNERPMDKQLAPPTMQIRTIPIVINAGGGNAKDRQRFGLLSPTDVGNMSAGEFTDEFGDSWAGGDLSIISEGVDERGNISLVLVGNCPRCGLKFGDVSADFTDAETMSLGYSTQDVEALSRVLASETTPKFGGDPYKSDVAKKEATAIGWTVLNRLRDPKQRYGSSVYDIATGGKGYGIQGPRDYSTVKEATPETTRMAKEILGGKYEDPTKGATHFIHDYGKAYSYGTAKGGDPTKGRPLPKFAETGTNTMILDTSSGITLRTYKPGRDKSAEDPRAQQMNKENVEKWNQAFGKGKDVWSINENKLSKSKS